MTEETGFNTRAIHSARDPKYSSISAPIFQSSTYLLESCEHGRDLASQVAPTEFYSRWGNPTVRTLENAIASLEGAEAALAVASGMAAASTAIVSNVKSGDHVVAGQSLYGEAPVLLGTILPRFGVETTFVEQEDISSFERALRPNTRLIYVESPANPTMVLADFEAIAAIAKPRRILTITDNTFATPYNQQPIRLGFDACVHSATKYFGGHSDLTAGVIAGSRAFIDRVWNHYRVFGPVLAPNDAWLVSRGIKTLGLRMEQHNRNAVAVAKFLAGHAAVARVNYPGLESHPQHGLAKKQMSGFGGMLSFELKGGYEAGRTFANSLKTVLLAVSLGGVDSLVSHPASMTHSFVPRDQREAAGITDGLIRMSVGCEDVQDIIEDLSKAL